MTTINQRFTDNAIASTRLDTQLVPALGTSTVKGPIQAPVDLKYIADNIQTNLVNPQSNASHARPSLLAHVTSFAQNVRTAILASSAPAAFVSLEAQVLKDYAEWQGMIAAVALTHVFSATGLDLSIETVSLSSSRPLDRCILLAMAKGDSAYRRAITLDPNDEPVSGHLYYICQAGRPFAIYHPEIGLCPMMTYDPTIFDGILSWYNSNPKDCHDGWQLLVQPGKPSVLDDVCLSRIVWWANNNNLIPYASFVRGCQADQSLICSDNMASGDIMTNAQNIDLTWPDHGSHFGMAAAYCLDKSPVPLLFADQIMVSYVGSSGQNKMVYNSTTGEKPLCFQGGIPELSAYAPVPPFLSESVPLFESCQIQNLSFEATVTAGNLGGIRVTLSVVNELGEVLTLRKYYNSRSICQGMVPYLMIWPYLPMPQGRTDIWKEFHATWHQQQSDGFIPLKRENGEMISMVEKLDFNFGSQGQIDQVYRITKKTESWPVCTGSVPFRYAILQNHFEDGRGLADMGMVFIPAYETCPMIHTDATLSVDFGTTSTVCALQSANLNGGSVTPLEYVDYSRTVTCEERGAKESVDVQHWLGNSGTGTGKPGDRWSWNRKIFSVAQLFGCNDDGVNNTDANVLKAGLQKCWRDGRMFLASGASMSLFASAASGSADPLRTQKIMNDMKFSGTLDVLNSHAATMYLAGIYSYAVLYFLDHKMVPSFEVRSSYPNDVTLAALRQNWNYARTVLGNVMDSSLTTGLTAIQFYNEATATAAYHLDPANALAGASSLVTVDIGGGTTDISITNDLRPDKDGELSFRYAGREMMVTSLIEYFRRFNSASSVNRQLAFNALWGSSDTNMVMLNQFDSLCSLPEAAGAPDMFLRNLLDNSSLRMNIELLLADGMHLDPVALDMDTPLLRQLITLKLLMVMRIVARCVAKNYKILLRPIDNHLDVNGSNLELNLSVSGASAQLMQYVFDCDISQLGMFRRNDVPSNTMDCAALLMEKIFDLELEPLLKNPEITGSETPVTTRLTIYVDANVKEKREVCHGMLQPSIASLAGQMAGTAAAKPGPGGAKPLDPFSLLGMPVQGAQAVVKDPTKTAAPAADTHMTDAERERKVKEMTVYLMQYDEAKLRAYLNGEYDEKGNYITGIRNFIETYENVVFGGIAKTNRGLGADVLSISDLLKEEKYQRHFSTCRTIMAKKRAAYMVENAQEDYQDLLACMYLVEELLNVEMAESQLK